LRKLFAAKALQPERLIDLQIFLALQPWRSFKEQPVLPLEKQIVLQILLATWLQPKREPRQLAQLLPLHRPGRFLCLLLVVAQVAVQLLAAVQVAVQVAVLVVAQVAVQLLVMVPNSLVRKIK
jgi:hypothetical protein